MIEQVGGDNHSGTIKVTAFGRSKIYDNVTKVVRRLRRRQRQRGHRATASWSRSSIDGGARQRRHHLRRHGNATSRAATCIDYVSVTGRGNDYLSDHRPRRRRRRRRARHPGPHRRRHGDPQGRRRQRQALRLQRRPTTTAQRRRRQRRAAGPGPGLPGRRRQTTWCWSPLDGKQARRHRSTVDGGGTGTDDELARHASAAGNDRRARRVATAPTADGLTSRCNGRRPAMRHRDRGARPRRRRRCRHHRARRPRPAPASPTSTRVRPRSPPSTAPRQVRDQAAAAACRLTCRTSATPTTGPPTRSSSRAPTARRHFDAHRRHRPHRRRAPVTAGRPHRRLHRRPRPGHPRRGRHADRHRGLGGNDAHRRPAHHASTALALACRAAPATTACSAAATTTSSTAATATTRSPAARAWTSSATSAAPTRSWRTSTSTSSSPTTGSSSAPWPPAPGTDFTSGIVEDLHGIFENAELTGGADRQHVPRRRPRRRARGRRTPPRRSGLDRRPSRSPPAPATTWSWSPPAPRPARRVHVARRAPAPTRLVVQGTSLREDVVVDVVGGLVNRSPPPSRAPTRDRRSRTPASSGSGSRPSPARTGCWSAGSRSPDTDRHRQRQRQHRGRHQRPRFGAGGDVRRRQQPAAASTRSPRVLDARRRRRHRHRLARRHAATTSDNTGTVTGDQGHRARHVRRHRLPRLRGACASTSGTGDDTLTVAQHRTPGPVSTTIDHRRHGNDTVSSPRSPARPTSHLGDGNDTVRVGAPDDRRLASWPASRRTSSSSAATGSDTLQSSTAAPRPQRLVGGLTDARTLVGGLGMHARRLLAGRGPTGSRSSPSSGAKDRPLHPQRRRWAPPGQRPARLRRHRRRGPAGPGARSTGIGAGNVWSAKAGGSWAIRFVGALAGAAGWAAGLTLRLTRCPAASSPPIGRPDRADHGRRR